MLQHCESLVQFLEDTNNSVVLLHILLGFPQCYLCVETTGKSCFEILWKNVQEYQCSGEN